MQRAWKNPFIPEFLWLCESPPATGWGWLCILGSGRAKLRVPASSQGSRSCSAGNPARRGFVELDKLLEVPVQEGRTGDVQRDNLKANLLALGLVYTQVNELQPIYLKLSM